MNSPVTSPSTSPAIPHGVVPLFLTSRVNTPSVSPAVGGHTGVMPLTATTTSVVVVSGSDHVTGQSTAAW
jgi:hypothetical protein